MEPTANFPYTVKDVEEFKLVCSSTIRITFQDSEWLEKLILFSGYLNATATCELLGEDVKQDFVHELERLGVLQQVCFDCLFKGEEVTALILEKYQIYAKNSLFDGRLLQDRIKEDTKTFFLADKTPKQTAQFFGLYKVEWIKTLVDTIFAKVISAINTRSIEEDTEKLLYKHAGLIWFGKSISIAELYYTWGSQSFKTSSLFFKLYLEGKKPLDQDIDFLKHWTHVLLHTFFAHEDTYLPEFKIGGVQEISKNLEHLFSSSPDSIIIAFCYINQLHELFDKTTKQFNFDQALFALKMLELDERDELYNFLHASLHYFRGLSILSDHKAFRFFLFYALYQLPVSKRRCLDISIQGVYDIQTFKVDLTTCRFMMNHFKNPWVWAKIFYTYLDSKGNFRFFEVNLKDHIELARIMEEFILKELLPIDLLENFLLNLPAKSTLVDVLQRIMKRKKEKTPFKDTELTQFRYDFLEALNINDDNLLKDMSQLVNSLLL